MDRKLIRPSLGTPPRGPSRARRAETGEPRSAEPGYLLQAIESRADFVVTLLGGGEVRGRLEGYDRDALTVRDASGAVHLVRKARIACYRMERAPAVAPSRGEV
jgi:hypothetical protein